MDLAAANKGPMFNGEWSPSDITKVKSLIISHKNNNNNNNTGNGNSMMSNKHKDIVDVLHEQFPWKDRHQVSDLYVDIMVEMIQCEENIGTTEPTVGGVHLENNNFGMPVEDPTMENMEILLDPLNVTDTRARKTAEKQPPRWPSTHQPKRQTHTGRFWSTEEHRLFLHGLRVYGRGNWKDISRYIVKTRTPVQVSSHAQKYFRRLERSAARQRYSINDVGLYHAEPWAAPTNSSGWKALAFTGGGNNSNSYKPYGQWSSQHAAMNNLSQVRSPFSYHVGEASTNETTMIGDHQMGYSATAIVPMEGTGIFVPGDQQGGSAPHSWMKDKM